MYWSQFVLGIIQTLIGAMAGALLAFCLGMKLFDRNEKKKAKEERSSDLLNLKREMVLNIYHLKRFIKNCDKVIQNFEKSKSTGFNAFEPFAFNKVSVVFYNKCYDKGFLHDIYKAGNEMSNLQGVMHYLTEGLIDFINNYYFTILSERQSKKIDHDVASANMLIFYTNIKSGFITELKRLTESKEILESYI